MTGLTLLALYFLLVVVALGPGVAFAWLARRARRAGRLRMAVSARASSIILFVLMPLWVVANGHAWGQHIQAIKEPYETMRALYVRTRNSVKGKPAAPWPPRWRGEAPEPTVDGKPLMYLPAASFRDTCTGRPDAWLAYSARVRRRFWYAPWSNVDLRAVLQADGEVRLLTEHYFQSLREQAGGQPLASCTTNAEAREKRDPHVVRPD